MVELTITMIGEDANEPGVDPPRRVEVAADGDDDKDGVVVVVDVAGTADDVVGGGGGSGGGGGGGEVDVDGGDDDGDDDGVTTSLPSTPFFTTPTDASTRERRLTRWFERSNFSTWPSTAYLTRCIPLTESYHVTFATYLHSRGAHVHSQSVGQTTYQHIRIWITTCAAGKIYGI